MCAISEFYHFFIENIEILEILLSVACIVGIFKDYERLSSHIVTLFDHYV